MEINKYIKKLAVGGALLGLTGCAHNDGIKLWKDPQIDETYQKKDDSTEKSNSLFEDSIETIKYHLARSEDKTLGPFYLENGSEMRVLGEGPRPINPDLELRLGPPGHKEYTSTKDVPPYGNIDELMQCTVNKNGTECRALPRPKYKESIYQMLMITVACNLNK